MSEKILRVGQIMRYKKFYPFTLKEDFLKKWTDVNFVYFMHPITTLQCFEKKNIKVDHKIQGCIIFGQIGLTYFFWEN